MEKFGIVGAVLSLSSPGFAYGDLAEVPSMARQVRCSALQLSATCERLTIVAPRYAGRSLEKTTVSLLPHHWSLSLTQQTAGE